MNESDDVRSSLMQKLRYYTGCGLVRAPALLFALASWIQKRFSKFKNLVNIESKFGFYIIYSKNSKLHWKGRKLSLKIRTKNTPWRDLETTCFSKRDIERSRNISSFPFFPSNIHLDPRLSKNGLGIFLSNIIYKLQLFQIIYEF